jgi:hypothetical protein
MGRRTRPSHGGLHTPLMACYHAVHSYPGGLPVVATLMAANPETLRKKLDPAQDTHRLALDEAMHILNITKDERVLDAITTAVGANWFWPLEPDQAPGDLDVLQVSTGLMRSAVDVITELEDALQDGDINADERARIDLRLIELSRQMKLLDSTSERFEQ